ncbi:TBC1 domain family member 22B [Nymphon striatum]|nr:TBC1 domain family member 22B [Nymphon striatum]
MQNFGEEANRDRTPFWKKTNRSVPGSIKPVYGAMHPPIDNTSRDVLKKDGLQVSRQRSNSSTNSSFDDFRLSTDDAWNVDVDEDFQLNADVAHDTALSVMDNHSRINSSEKSSFETSPSSNHMNGMFELCSIVTILLSVSFSELTGSISPNHQDFNRTCSPSLNGPGVGIRQSSDDVPGNQLSYQYIRQKLTIPDRQAAKLEKISTLLHDANTSLENLCQQSWSGIPRAVRAITWRILSGYLPANLERRQPTLERKREEYFNFVKQYYETRHEELYQDTYRQIHIDIPRMSPLIPLFQQEKVQEVFERILYIWAIRHPASGYVQGINDLVTPFFVVFLQEAIGEDEDVENYEVIQLDSTSLDKIEADTFWLMSKLLEGIQDNYTFAQPGIQLKVNQLKELVKRIDEPLHMHLQKHNIEYLQFTFRWMNNLLMRELPLSCTIRLWDTYLCEPDGFASFHLYVCAAFLIHWSKDLLREKDFQSTGYRYNDPKYCIQQSNSKTLSRKSMIKRFFSSV